MNIRNAVWVLNYSVLVLSCSTGLAQDMPQQMTNELLNGTVWVQTALEHEVLCAQAYELAQVKVDAALHDKNWTAATEQTSGYEELPPAVILDVDETVLDNSSFQARLVKHDVEFDTKIWLAWVLEEQATEMPGAKAFIEFLVEKDVAVFFVTNRTAAGEQATVNNLASVLGMSITNEQVLCKYEKNEWVSDKTSRRALLSKSHRILLLVGDDFNDFAYLGKVSPAGRVEKGVQYKSYFGTKWIQLPNPLYGNWEKSIYNYDYSTSRDDKLRLKYNLLKTSEGAVGK